MSIMEIGEINFESIAQPILQDPLHSASRFDQSMAAIALTTYSKAGQRRLRTENVAAPKLKGMQDELINVLIKYSKPHHHGNPVISASAAGDTQAVKILLDNGFGFELDRMGRNSPLYEAINNGHVQTAKLLIDYGHPLDGYHLDGRGLEHIPPIFIAAQRGQIVILEYLLAKGANPNSLCPHSYCFAVYFEKNPQGQHPTGFYSKSTLLSCILGSPASDSYKKSMAEVLLRYGAIT